MQSSNMKAAIAARDEYQSEWEREAFAAGYDHAHGIACHNVPNVGEEYWTESEGRVTPQDVEHARELHEALCFEAEMGARCFSLGEWEAESAWEAYDAGVALAIEHDLSGYTDSDYLAD